jgi:type IV pilus assembly protein PilB
VSVQFTKRKKLIDIVKEKNLLNDKQIAEFNKKNVSGIRKIIETLVKNFKLTEETLAECVAIQNDLKYVNLKEKEIDPIAVKRIPENVARFYGIMPIKKEGAQIIIAMSDPSDVLALDELSVRTNLDIIPLVASHKSIIQMIGKHYKASRKQVNVDKVMQQVDDSYKGKKVEKLKVESNVDESSAPIVQLANSIIEESYHKKASDIHMESTEEGMIVRFRIDGMMQEVYNIPPHAKKPLISRCKIMSNLKIEEKRLPQDGRIQFKDYGDLDIDLRVSTKPAIEGDEDIVMRLLDKSSTALGLDALGFSEHNLRRYRDAVKKPYGMLLNVGPTGSGKTTTLYSALNEINKPEIKILTAEDPVEYTLPGIRQTQINPKIGLTFPRALSTFLRQDPDVIMVGEIRDFDTAKIAVEAALTGHLLLSTLHTNDAAGTVTRLIEMEIEPFLVSSSVLAVLAQRLVRKICPNCKKSQEVNSSELKELGFGMDIKEGKYTIYKGEGCEKCDGSGHKGRLGLHELLTMNDEIKNLILKRASAGEIKKAAIAGGMVTLQEDGFQKMLSGATTAGEVLRTTRGD